MAISRYKILRYQISAFSAKAYRICIFHNTKISGLGFDKEIAAIYTGEAFFSFEISFSASKSLEKHTE